MDCNPSENRMPSSAVGREGKVLSTRLASMPFSKGAYRLGSKVSVCAIPPATHSRMTESAVEGPSPEPLPHPESRLATGAPAANAASAAALDFLRKSLRFQLAFISLSFNKLTEIPGVRPWPRENPVPPHPSAIYPMHFQQSLLPPATAGGP